MLRNYRLQNYNFKLVFNVLVLMAMSLLFIHSAKASYVPKQALGIIMGLGIIVVVSLIDYQVFTRNAEILYILNVIMLIGVKLFGKDVNGAKRWFSLGPLGTFQPSELSKVIMIIVVAAFLAKHQDDLNEGIRKTCCNLWNPAAFDLETAKSFFYTRYLFYYSWNDLYGRIILQIDRSGIDRRRTTFSNLFVVCPDTRTGVVRATSGSKDHVLFTSRELRRFHCFTDKQFDHGDRCWRTIWQGIWK